MGPPSAATVQATKQQHAALLRAFTFPQGIKPLPLTLAPTRLPFEPLLLPQRGCETKGRGGPADGLGSLGRRLRGLPEGRSRPERAQIGLVLASQTGAANEKRTSAPWRHMQPPHPSPPWDHAAYKCRVQCGAAAGRCSRAEWRRRRRSRQAGLRVARFSYPFSRQRDASSQPAALGQPCRSALASHRHLRGSMNGARR